MANDINFYASSSGYTFRPLDVEPWNSSDNGTNWCQAAPTSNAYGQQWPSQSSLQSSGHRYATIQDYAGYTTAPGRQSKMNQSYAQTSAQTADHRNDFCTYQSSGAKISSTPNQQNLAPNATVSSRPDSTDTSVGHLHQGNEGPVCYHRQRNNPTTDQSHRGNSSSVAPGQYQPTHQTGGNAASTSSEVTQSINPSQIPLGRPPTQQVRSTTRRPSLPQTSRSDPSTARQHSLHEDFAASTSNTSSLDARQGPQHKRKRTVEASPAQSTPQHDHTRSRLSEGNRRNDQSGRRSNIHHDQRSTSGAERSQPSMHQHGNGLLSAEQIQALRGNDEQRPQTDSEPAAQTGAVLEWIPQQTEDQQESPSDGRPAPPAPVGRWAMTAAGLQDSFARPQISLPPVIGAHLHYSNMKVKYNPVPEKLEEIRHKLFQVKEPVLLNSQQIADYWPHMSNVWHRSVSKEENDNGTSTEVWECRQKRRTVPRARPEREKGSRLRVSKKQMLEGQEACPLKLTVVHYTKHADTEENHHIGFGACKCLPEWLYLRRTDRTWDKSHNHDLEQLDKYKHSDGIMYFAQNKVEEGYSFSAVANWLHEKYGEVTSQAQFITKQDVANVAQKWRQHNKDVVLKTVVEEPTAEENEQKRCQELINSTTPQGLMKALAAICESIPSALPIALPVLEAMQHKRTNEAGEELGAASLTSNIAEGVHIVAPSPGIPWKTLQRSRYVPSGYQMPEESPQPKRPAVAVSHAAARSAAGLKWSAASVSGHSTFSGEALAPNSQSSPSGAQGIVMYVAPTRPPAVVQPGGARAPSCNPRSHSNDQTPARLPVDKGRAPSAALHGLPLPGRPSQFDAPSFQPQQTQRPLYYLPSEAPGTARDAQENESWTPSWLRQIDARNAPDKASDSSRGKTPTRKDDNSPTESSLAVEQQLQAELDASV